MPQDAKKNALTSTSGVRNPRVDCGRILHHGMRNSLTVIYPVKSHPGVGQSAKFCNSHFAGRVLFLNSMEQVCLKNQPDALPVQYTQLSLGQAIKLQL